MYRVRYASPAANLIVLINVLCLCIDHHGVYAAIYNNHLSIKLQMQQGSANGFFGYSVALQQGTPTGTPPRLVVGAPKDGANRVGSVFVCPVVESDSVASDKSCKRFTIDQQHIENTKNIRHSNTLFGASIDGGIGSTDDLLIGAPRLTEIDSELDFYSGGVFHLSDIERNKFAKFPVNPGDNTMDSKYLFGMAQFGFALHAVNSTEFLYGTPGYGHWIGNAWRTYYTDGSIVPEARHAPLLHQRAKRALKERIQDVMRIQLGGEDSALGGYAVTSGRFFGHTSYVVGLPNDRQMQGSVKLYALDVRNGMSEEHIRWPRIDHMEMAEHFGSALVAADVDGDGYDDLLVGAPNANDNIDYDNGKVYVFISNGVQGFKLHQVLMGKARSRFGTSLSNLGRITLDQHESVAVGSPYEDAVGAVSVYVWVDEKLTLDSKVSLREFPSFGYSLSRAVDVDSNNFADLAVGAYKSNAVAILKAKTVFSYNVTMEHNTLYADRPDNALEVTICSFTQGIATSVDTMITYEFDARINQNTITENTTTSSGRHCRSFSMELRPKVLRTTALTIVVKLQERTCDTCPVRSPTFPSKFDKKIPFKLNCMHDPCLPQLQIETNMQPSSGPLKFVVGEVHKPEFIVKVTNQGDPALACTIDVSADRVPLPIRGAKCADKCEFDYIISEASQRFTLDFTSWSSFHSHLDLKIAIECFNASVKSTASLKLEYKSALVLERIQLTQQYDSLNASTFDMTGAAIFHIRNDGPSQLEEAVYFVEVPRLSHELHIQDVYKPESNENAFCEPVSDAFDTPVAYVPVDNPAGPEAAGFGSSTSLDNTIACDHPDVQCISIRCRVRSLAKGHISVINIPTRPDITAILKNYRTTFSIISTIHRETDDVLYQSEFDVVDKQTVYEGVAIWIIIVAILGALLLLALIIFALYKLGFFYRAMHEQLMEEMEAEAGLEGVELRRPPGTDDASPEGASPDEPDKPRTEKSDFEPPLMLC